MKDKIKLGIVKNMVEGILSWSDRIGSDEIAELKEILKIMNEVK